MRSVLDDSAGRVFFDGFTTEPRLDHPEGIAIHRDGSVWCGGEAGQIYRIASDGASVELIASTGGFILGLAFDPAGTLYFCDLFHQAVYRLAAGESVPERFAAGTDDRALRIPNSVAVDVEGRLYVSDSYAFKEPGPGIFRFDADGNGESWYGDPLNFANGLALSPDGCHLYVAETFAHAVSRIPILDDGSAGFREEVVLVPGVLPDGLAFGPDGGLYVGCYEPSQILRVAENGNAERFFWDPEAHLLCHPTNIAFRGSTMFTANLGRWHVTAIETGLDGAVAGSFVHG